MATRPQYTPTAMRLAIDVVLALHLVAAGVYWFFSPHGFPVSHSRFWLNSVLPLVIVGGCVVALLLLRRRRNLAGLMILCISFGWAAAAILGSILFPTSLAGLWGVGVAAVLFGLFCSVLLLRGERMAGRIWIPCVAAWTGGGAFIMWAQLPPPATTNPIDDALPLVEARAAEIAKAAKLQLALGQVFDIASAQWVISRGAVDVVCQPLLEFDRIAPDGFWSLAAPANAVPRSLRAYSYTGQTHQISYSDGTAVVIPPAAAPNEGSLTSYAVVPCDTFSHLNSFCFLAISGHRRLWLTFSPCSETPIEVLPFDYPTGRAERMAYIDHTETFSVVEGKSGEKGPFTLLASGHLSRGEPLTIVLSDDGQPVASIALDDWSQQVSTALSPTAGWGLPMNAIEFMRSGDSPSSSVTIWISLAATSVGRGWDTVGHRAGTYRNRLRIHVEPQ